MTAPTATPHLAARQEYTARQRSFAALRRERQGVSTRLSVARLVVFLLLVGVLAVAVADAVPPTLPGAIGAGLLALFIVLVRLHGRVRREEERFELLERVNALSERRAARDWNALPPSPAFAVPDEHPYAVDLEIFGRASLWQLLPEVSPSPARPVLASWLTAPASPDEIVERQAAVRELIPLVDFRDDLTASASSLAGVPEGVVPAAIRLPETIAWFGEEPWLLPLARILTAASVITWGAVLFGALPFVAGLVPLTACTILWGSRAARLRRTFARADTLATALPWYVELIERIAAENLTSDLLRRHRETLGGETGGASAALGALRRILVRAEVRYSPMMHLPLQALGLWDLHVAGALARWCRQHGSSIEPWFRALGEVESLAALGGLGHANPAWCLPTLTGDGSATRLEARALGHPLISPERMVANDLTIGPPGTFVLVTGSNMSGKSTLLRAAGLNAVLAQAGAPVCASEFVMAPLRVFTSIRIQDSLRDGVSLFMAELRRLRQVVDAAEEPLPAPPVLYLLDEMLHGTNSAERHVAARTVLARLVRSRAIGLVTTHDVALATSPELASVAHTVFFDETVHDENAPLSFDYRLRQGVVPAGNALRLLALVGLGDGPAVRSGAPAGSSAD